MRKDKIIGIFIGILSIVVICLVCVQLLGEWKDAINIIEPLLGVVFLLQSIQFWNKNRKLAVFQLCVSIYTFVVTILIVF